MHARRALALVATDVALSAALAAPASAQKVPYICPARGQTPEQQGQDEYACYNWAKQQTGVDALRPQAASAPSGGGSSAVGSTVGGAAVGALGGAVVGNLFGKKAKTGALFGGGTGALVGPGRADESRQAAQQAQRQAEAGQQAQVAEYYRAFACMTGRGYAVS